ncbi:MAG: ferrous iron transport protein B [Sinobacterium sp.]|nr:ferrous iron transport protein B [Sinobacterium sp.]
MKQIAIIGSPNCGKTTLFNRLTGARQRTGNWPGVTVERKEGRLSLADQAATLIDLPGVYSLSERESAIDAQVARDYLATNNTDLLIFIVDATRIERQLMLLPQLQQQGQAMVIVVNMLDSARRDDIHIDLTLLEKKTGTPVVGICAASGEGLDKLKAVLGRELTSPANSYQLQSDIPALAAAVSKQGSGQTITDRIDHWLLHPWLAFPVFLLVMYLLFSISVNLGAVFIDFFDIWLGSWIVDGSRWLLQDLGSPDWLTALLADGVGGGLQLISTFIPVIGCLYLCMSILEDSGYLSRATFVIDALMSRIGLPGQAFIPLIVGFGCNVPSVMASRSLDRPSARLTTIFIAPFMSCGARLSVYVFVGTAMFPEQAGKAIFLLYLLGIVVAVFSAWLLRVSLFRDESSGHISEMPAYHMPLLRNILTQTWQRLYAFMFRAGKRILAVVMLLSIISSVGTDGSWGNQDTENSVLAYTGKTLTPMFVPMGIGEDNWPATVGLFTGLFAKEVVVGTLDTLYSPVVAPSEGDKNTPPDFSGDFMQALQSISDNFSDLVAPSNSMGDLSDSQQAADNQGVRQSSYTAMMSFFPSAWAAFCYLVFILLYAPCVATIGVMQKESSSQWLQFSIAWSLLLSYWLASNLWQMSQVLENPIGSLAWLVGSSVVLAGSYWGICYRVKRHYKDDIPMVNL